MGRNLPRLPLKNRILVMLFFTLIITSVSLASTPRNAPLSCEACCNKRYQCCLASCSWWNLICRYYCGDDESGLTYCVNGCNNEGEGFCQLSQECQDQ
jgi:hypothetical protein